MQGYLLQDWVTIRGASSLTQVKQGADEWLDLGDYEDVAITLDVRNVTNAAIFYETSPAKQDASFLAMVSRSTATGIATLATGQFVDRCYASLASVPPAQFLRWRLAQVTASTAWEATFRIWVAAYAWVKP